MSSRERFAWVAALVLGASARADAVPLDPYAPTPRAILVELESSLDVGAVGVTYGPPVPATWSVSGGIGTVTIPIASHEQMRTVAIPPVPGSYTPFVIQIDLGDLSATSATASGENAAGGQSIAFTQNPLGTDTLAGHLSSQSAPLFCTSQQEVDAQCQVNPSYCGLTCEIVPGAAYDPATGKLNLVGSELIEACDGFCFPPFLFFSEAGDLRLSEAGSVPAFPPAAVPVLVACLLLVGRAAWAQRGGVGS